WFLGAYHNTCDESIDYFDVDRVPDRFRPALSRLQEAMDAARRLDAQERCRRFESAPTDIDADQALAHVQEHARDIGQPRPEYGHATNAVCVIGRRSRTRGLYLDRRAFLVSYDPTTDPDGEVLARLLLSAGPVGAGINLEYYFSSVDPVGYGSGTKLPHNITAMVGVMDGHTSDLRTGLPWQMVEIHEPMRLLMIAEATPELL
ncbi:putative inorganic carbon transporter subunit DabA, partial [Frankia sp. CiP3]|uniref:putative inorganic carbon transporter subunit DabA n=1 Tax=Frankia sp. CiP3 TaxID=2880971 RepID=UPI001EF44033